MLHSCGVIPILTTSLEQAHDHIKLKQPDLVVVDAPGVNRIIVELLDHDYLHPDQIVAVIGSKKSDSLVSQHAFGLTKFIQKPTTSADYANRILGFLDCPILKEARCQLPADAWLQQGNRLQKVDVVDLCSNGICLATNERLGVGRYYIVKLTLGETSFHVTLRVVWRNRNLRGCSFEMMGGFERATLVTYLAQHQCFEQAKVVGY
jgi:hypothetical protein